MNTYTIDAGNHYCLHPLKIHWNKKRLIFEFMFTESCKYNLGTEDQLDWNKYFGIGFGFNHHKNSYRVGSRYDPISEKFLLSHYSYNHGVRSYPVMCPVDLNQHYMCVIGLNRAANSITNTLSVAESGDWKLIYAGGIDFDFNGVSRLGFNLWPYQGGNIPAPHKMDYMLGEL